MAIQEISLRYDNFYEIDKFLPNCLPYDYVAECVLSGSDELNLQDSLESPVQNGNFIYMLELATKKHNLKITIDHVTDPIEPNSICFYVIEPVGNPQKYLEYSPFIDSMSKDALTLLQQNKMHLIINYSMEGFDHTLHNYVGLIDILEKNSIPVDRTSFLTSNQKYGHVTNFIIVTNWFEEAYQHSYIDMDMIDDSNRFVQTPNTELREKHYLMMNRIPRFHRHTLVASLLNAEILDKGFVSFPGYNDWEKYNDKSLRWQHTRSRDYDHEIALDRASRELEEITPLVIDEDNFSENFAFGYEKSWPYDQSYFSLVTETDFYAPDAIFFSEKIWKPILNYHPFILAGTHHSLKTLQDMGYKTFSNWWDESYDEIKDPYMRLDKIIEVMENLCALPLEDIHDMYQEMIPVLEYNRQHFLNRQPNSTWLSEVLEKGV